MPHQKSDQHELLFQNHAPQGSPISVNPSQTLLRLGCALSLGGLVMRKTRLTVLDQLYAGFKLSTPYLTMVQILWHADIFRLNYG